MKLQIGNKVRFIDEKGEGIIKEILPNSKVVVEIDGFEYTYLKSQVLTIPEGEEGAYKKTFPEIDDSMSHFISQKEERGNKSSFKSTSHPSKRVKAREVDLHIHELVEDYHKMSNAEILRKQIHYFKQVLEDAISKNEQKVVFIHGVGEGVLKEEIHRILREYTHIDYNDAPYHKYGYGATMIEIH